MENPLHWTRDRKKGDDLRKERSDPEEISFEQFEDVRGIMIFFFFLRKVVENV